MSEDPFISRMRMAIAQATAVADQDRTAALEDLENVMDALRLPPEERAAIRTYATPERLYCSRLIPSVIVEAQAGEDDPYLPPFDSFPVEIEITEVREGTLQFSESDFAAGCRCKGCQGAGKCRCCDEPRMEIPDDLY